MPFLPIQLPAGLERNGTPYDSVRSWWDMNLCRWVSGSARPLGGWVRKTVTPLGEPVRRFHAWQRNTSELRTIAATETKLYIDYGAGWVDITPSGIVPPVIISGNGYGAGPYGASTYGTPRAAGISDIFVRRYALWSFANWGEDPLLLSSEDGRLFRYVSATPTTDPVPLAEPPHSKAVAVTDERHVMLAGPVIGGTYYANRICWASQESLTDWDFASVVNSAGFLDLTVTSPLNFLVKVREGILAFTSTEVFLVRYLGMPYVYGASKIAEMPMFHPYSITSYGVGNALWFSPRAFQMYAGGSVQPLPCPIFNDIKVDFSLEWGPVRCHASSNGNFPEIWLFWPSLNAVECDRYAIFNYLESWWGWGYLNRSAMISSGPLKRPLAGTADGTIYEHENGWTDAGLPILANRWLETGALGIGGGDKVMNVKQALLSTQDNFHDTKQSVKLQFYGRYAPDGDERVFGPYLPRLDGYTDTRVNAREARVRVISNIDGLFDIGTLRLDVVAGGGR
jgi:hypothetical protein